MTPRERLLLHFIQACSEADTKSLWLHPKQGWKSDSILIVACNALFSYQTQVKTSLLTTMPSPQELTGSTVPKTRSHHKHRETKPPQQIVTSKSVIRTTARQGPQSRFPLNIMLLTSMRLQLIERSKWRLSLPQPHFLGHLHLIPKPPTWHADSVSTEFLAHITATNDLCKQAVKSSCIYFSYFLWNYIEMDGGKRF